MLRKSNKDSSSMGVTVTLTVSHGLAFLIALMILLNFLSNPYAIPRQVYDDRQILVDVNSALQTKPTTAASAIGAALQFSKDDISSEAVRRNLDITRPRKAKVLMGIVTADVFGEPRYREAFRDLLSIHPKVCRLSDYMYSYENRHDKASKKILKRFDQCELIYTFVLGANVDPNGPTEIVNTSFPILAPPSTLRPQHSLDFNQTDMTFLNIRENMNDGKSQTWFYYAGTVCEKYGIEYAGKMDTDSLPYLDKYFEFADTSLPPVPYSTRILAGTIVDKRWWPKRSDAENDVKEAYFNKRYSTLHLYAAGQMYIMSQDLAKGVGDVCSNMAETRTHAEGHEDHDVSMMAFLALQDSMDHPIKLVIIALDNPWWKHETKLRYGVRKWRKAWDAEIQRMQDLIMGPKIQQGLTIGSNFNDTEFGESENHRYNAMFEPLNIHEDYPLTCVSESISEVDISSIHPVTFPLFRMVHGYSETAESNTVGKTQYSGPMETGVKQLKQEQSCLYTGLHRWWDLSAELNITRWVAHGESAMSATCHRSINPWDNSVEITIDSCAPLQKLYNEGGIISSQYTDIDKNQYMRGPWNGRLLDDEWMLLKPNRESQLSTMKNGGGHFKLKSISQSRMRLTENDISGVDILCFDDIQSPVSRDETSLGNGNQNINGKSEFLTSNDEFELMKKSGFKEYLMGNMEVDIVHFGPSKIQLMPATINNKYLLERFERPFYCDYPFDDTIPLSKLSPYTLSPPARASQLENSLSKWYIPQSKRMKWLDSIDKVSGTELTKEIPNLDAVEIDNSIADPAQCRTDSDGLDAPLKVISFNMERGTYWSEFVRMVRNHWALERPDVIILNEMDIGMARSNNVHTTRKLAFELGMNYAWGLEFVELTNGNYDEQNATIGMENALGLTGNAILSNCKLYDPLIIRDDLDDAYFSSKRSYRNSRASQQRLGGRMGLFARIGSDESVSGDAKHMVLGSVYELHPSAHREKIWEYLGFGTPVEGILSGTPPEDQISTVIGGGFDRKFCIYSGLNNLDQPRRHKTWPVDCAATSFGKSRGDQFCGNNPSTWEDEAYLPCFTPKGLENQASPIQISDHAIIQIRLH